ncbi:MAG: VCBS repeat-containing protein, partial [Flavitalea sp.]
DGKIDLYVGSGGYEVAENDPALQDRLYINDGKGNFTKKDKSFPDKLSGTGTVKAADIDGDGDMDLFVGARVVPGRYPETPDSRVLFNDGKGNFSDETSKVSTEIQKIGMVTDAVWMDLNEDKQPDLVIVGEWMPVKVFINQKGKLTDASSTYIKFASNGWWNTILAEDMDGDGDKDLIIGNLGNNGQFHASEARPLNMYYKDFDGNGSIDPLFCYYFGDVSYPAVSRDDLMDQLPFLKKNFLKYSSYSTATINDLLTKEQLDGAGILKANLLTTVFLQNNGAAGFALKTLPQEAQYAPVYAAVATDVNGDGNKDLVLAGNNIWTRIRFSRYDANHGMVLLGDGKGNFKYATQPQTGLNVRGEVRALEIVNKGQKTQLIFGLNDSKTKEYDLQK